MRFLGIRYKAKNPGKPQAIVVYGLCPMAFALCPNTEEQW